MDESSVQTRALILYADYSNGLTEAKYCTSTSAGYRRVAAYVESGVFSLSACKRRQTQPLLKLQRARTSGPTELVGCIYLFSTVRNFYERCIGEIWR